MNIDDQVNQIVQNIIDEISTKVQVQVAAVIDQKINDIIKNIDAGTILTRELGKRLDQKINQLPLDAKSIESQLQTRIEQLSTNIGTTVQSKSVAAAQESINRQVSKIDFQSLCQGALVAMLKNQSFDYPESSIPGRAIDQTNWLISGDIVDGGIIKNFGSTGIDDKSTQCQLTILDEATVVENNLLTKDLTVKGTVQVEGDLVVTGNIPESSPMYQTFVTAATNNIRTSLDKVVFDHYANLVYEKVRSDGLDLSKITLNGQEIVDGPNLAPNITNSNLQKLGILRELQVSGETLLSQTLYSTKGRIGVNTIEPAQAVSIWDQEIEIGIGKQSNGVAVIETPRNQTLVLSSNGKNNLKLTDDGSVTVNQLSVGATVIASSDRPPADNQKLGTIVFNANPSLGGPIGWVSLGGARWANFGIID